MPVTHRRARLCLPLARLLDVIDNGLGDEPGAHLLRFQVDDVGMSVGLRPLDDGEHPVDTLLGFEADPAWDGVGLVADGTARSTDPTDGRPPAPARVRLLYAVDRRGASASRLRPLDGTGEVLHPDEPEGHVADVCRRALGLATPPAPMTPVGWLATLWLDQILAAVLTQTRRWTWAELVEWHPLVADGPVPTGPDDLLQLARAAEALTWTRLRRLTAGGQGVTGVEPEVAAWMDDGMFARWLLGWRPDLSQILADLASLLDPASLASVTKVVRAWGLG